MLDLVLGDLSGQGYIEGKNLLVTSDPHRADSIFFPI
jgi:hypothetical protein